jgi:hypothetical protein
MKHITTHRPVTRPNTRILPLLALIALAPAAQLVAQDKSNSVSLGRLSANPYAPDSTSNKHSRFGSPYSATSIHNASGPYGNRFSDTSVSNPYAQNAPKIIAEDGTYLGRLSANRYDPESVSNPHGKYGSPYSATSIHNPSSPYGSKFSPLSPNNPYATQAPQLKATR